MPNYNSTLQTNNSSLEGIITQLNNMPDAGGTDPVLQDKTVTPTTSKQTVTADSGYDGLDTVIVNAMPTATQATPTVSINSSTGLITATATQTAGYVSAGTKNGTKQLAFQAAKTITPNTANQTAVSANTYVGGAVTVKGDANLVPSNIVSGKSIFGVVGTATTGGGSDPFAVPFTYTVDAISGASYGFALNSAGYYESQNKGQNSSYAICRVNLTVNSTCDIVFDVINYAESNCDYALFGNIDSALTLSYTADSSVKQSFKYKQSSSVVNVTYSNVSAGNHFIDIKFIKDSSYHSNNDSVQFKIQAVELSQEIIDKIIAADPDLTASNIKSGVDIFGVVGTYEGTSTGDGGDTSAEDGIITRTISGTYTNDRITSIGSYAFCRCSNLTSVSFSKCTTIDCAAFIGCASLTSARFPVCTIISNSAFYNCSSLTSISFPECIHVSGYAFANCSSLISANFPLCSMIGLSAFYNCSKLTSVSFPKCSYIGNNAFASCSSLISANFPLCKTVNSGAFKICKQLVSINFPVCTSIGNYAFSTCTALTTVSFPACTRIQNVAFELCTNLSQIYLTASSVCALNHSNAFSNTAITSSTGSIFVPASLVASYKAATNWTYFSNRIFGV